MIGLDSFVGTKGSLVGIDWLNLTSGAFKTAGGAFSSQGSNTPDADAKQADKVKLEEQKKAAEASASTWKKVGVAGVVAVVVGFLWMRHKRK